MCSPGLGSGGTTETDKDPGFHRVCIYSSRSRETINNVSKTFPMSKFKDL